MSKTQKFFLAGIIFLAIFFRFFQITTMPGGLFPDEAANGLDIDLMEQGQLQPFYERGNGREALFFYMLWGSVKVFGKGPWQHHAVSALVGTLSVIFCFAVTRRLFLIDLFIKKFSSEKGSLFIEHRANNLALLSAFLMAVSTWHVALSRTAFRANLIPLFASLTFYFILAVYQAGSLKKQLIYSTLSGAAFAMGFYTYIAYRILVPILLVLVFWPLLAALKNKTFLLQLKKYWKNILLFVVSFVIFIYPLAKYFVDHPGSFVGRSGQVSVFNPELNGGNLPGAVFEVSKLSLLAYFTEGDLNWRHNISGLAFLPPFVSPFFGVALLVVTFLAAWYVFAPLKRIAYWKYALLAGWFWGMLIPVITTAEGIPHGLRAIGTIPAVFIISALGLYKLGELAVSAHRWLWRKYEMQHIGKWLVSLGLKVLVGCFVLASVLYSYFWYFGYAAASPDNFYSFRSDLTFVSRYLNERCQKHNTYLVLDKFSLQTPDYLTNLDPANPVNPCNKPYTQVDPENAWQMPSLALGDEAVFTQSSLFDTVKFKKFHPETYLALEIRNKFKQTIMAVYRVRN